MYGGGLPRVAELLRKAIEWQGLLETDEVPSQAEIARKKASPVVVSIKFSLSSA